MVKTVFRALVAIFIGIAFWIFIPFSAVLKSRLFPLVAILAIVFFLLGIKLLLLTFKKKTKGRLEKFLILTGASSSGFFLSVILHNLVSGLFFFEEPFFFILAILVCPIGFLIGVVGAIYHWRCFGKTEKKEN